MHNCIIREGEFEINDQIVFNYALHFADIEPLYYLLAVGNKVLV